MTTAFLTHDLIARGKRGVRELLHTLEATKAADAEAHFSNVGRLTLTVCDQFYTQRVPTSVIGGVQ